MIKEKLTPYIRKMHQEHVRRMEGEERKILEKYVSERDKEIKVDWERLLNDHHSFIERASEGVSDKNYESLLYYLQIKGVLAYEGRKGSFFINGCGMKLNPSDNAVNYEFTRKEDAETFRKVKYGRAMYNTQICQNC